MKFKKKVPCDNIMHFIHYVNGLNSQMLLTIVCVGIAQWYLEQAQLIIEQDCLPRILENPDDAQGKKPKDWIYVLKSIDKVGEDSTEGINLLRSIFIVSRLIFFLNTTYLETKANQMLEEYLKYHDSMRYMIITELEKFRQELKLHGVNSKKGTG